MVFFFFLFAFEPSSVFVSFWVFNFGSFINSSVYYYNKYCWRSWCCSAVTTPMPNYCFEEAMFMICCVSYNLLQFLKHLSGRIDNRKKCFDRYFVTKLTDKQTKKKKQEYRKTEYLQKWTYFVEYKTEARKFNFFQKHNFLLTNFKQKKELIAVYKLIKQCARRCQISEKLSTTEKVYNF